MRGDADESGSVWRTRLWPLPYRVGRELGSSLRLSSTRVSQRHAEFFLRDGRLWVRDLRSTNGTFVNGDRVGERELAAGDILHFADRQFVLEATESASVPMETLRFSRTERGPVAAHIERTRSLVELLRTGAVRVEFQPLVRLADGAVVAYEALGRGDRPGAPCSPGELLGVAEPVGLAGELSALFRERQLEEARRLPGLPSGDRPRIFLNTHPSEMSRWETLLDSLRRFRSVEPDLPVVLEIHESAVTDLDTFCALRKRLDGLGVRLAFDDFGAGQARLEELCEVSPDYVKFDLHFARDLHRVSEKRREMVRALVRMMLDMSITTVVEGVEDAEEATACRELGFDLAQGYHFGRPAPLAALPRL